MQGKKKRVSLQNYLTKNKTEKMKSIVLLICSVIATTLFAQPTRLEMKDRYYMKGEVSAITMEGSGNAKTVAEDIHGNFVFGGKALMGGKDYATDWTKKYNVQTGESSAETANKTNSINDCIALPDGKVACVANPFLNFSDVQNGEATTTNIPSSIVGFERLVYNPVAEHFVLFGVNKTNDLWRPNVNKYQIGGGYIESPFPKALLFGYNSFEDYHKNSFATINNQNFAIWAYEADNKEVDQTALIGLVGYKEGRGGADKIDVKEILNTFVSDFKPYTRYENTVYEEFYKVQWAISGIHSKEDGSFFVTVSFIHWTTTSSGKAGYQKGILGVEYVPSAKPAITNTWVVFPWEVKEATSVQPKLEIKPYYTSYIGGNDIAVFDQETGHLFAINSDLDACKSTDELGTCQAKSKELQKWLIVNRLIARIEPTGYSLGFAHPNTAPANGERKAITLVQNVNGSEFKVIKFNP